MVRILFVLLIINVPSISFSQIELLKQETISEIEKFTIKLNRSLKKDYRKLTKDNNSKLEILNIYSLNLASSIKKVDYFKNLDFLKYLEPVVSKKRKLCSLGKYIRGQALLIDQNGQIKASAEDYKVFKYPEGEYLSNSYRELLKAKEEHKIRLFFHLSGTNGLMYFGLSEVDTFVIDIYKNKTYLLQDFIQNNWDDLLLVNI
jgi:hypothetical protein